MEALQNMYEEFDDHSVEMEILKEYAEELSQMQEFFHEKEGELSREHLDWFVFVLKERLDCLDSVSGGIDCNISKNFIRNQYEDLLSKVKSAQLSQEMTDLQGKGLLEQAKLTGAHLVAEGDWGGQIYFTIPAKQVKCSEGELHKLVRILDQFHWDCNEGEGSGLYCSFRTKKAGVEICGDWMLDELWTFEDQPQELKEYIKHVLNGENDENDEMDIHKLHNIGLEMNVNTRKSVGQILSN